MLHFSQGIKYTMKIYDLRDWWSFCFIVEWIIVWHSANSNGLWLHRIRYSMQHRTMTLLFIFLIDMWKIDPVFVK